MAGLSCNRGVENAGDPSSDYELWSPSDGRQSGVKCLLGHQVRYTRRRRASTCYNGQMYERVEFRKHCPCAEEDYECDFGYERSTDGGPCVAVMAISALPPTECRGTYTTSNGYRLVAGDTCDSAKGVDHLPTVKRCPGLFSGAAAEVSIDGSHSAGPTTAFVPSAHCGRLALCVPQVITATQYTGEEYAPTLRASVESAPLLHEAPW